MIKSRKFIILFISILLLIILYELGMKKSKKSYSIYTEIDTPISQFDFGTIKYLDTLYYSFKIINIGNELLIIDNISTNSSSTTFQLNDSIIPPNYETELNVKFIAHKPNIGTNNIKINVGGNFDNRITELHLTGIVAE